MPEPLNLAFKTTKLLEQVRQRRSSRNQRSVVNNVRVVEADDELGCTKRVGDTEESRPVSSSPGLIKIKVQVNEASLSSLF